MHVDVDVVMQDKADADKERVAQVKASLPPVPKQAKATTATKADKAPRAKSAYLVSPSIQRPLRQSLLASTNCALNQSKLAVHDILPACL